MDSIIVSKSAHRLPWGAYQVKRHVVVNEHRFIVSFIQFTPGSRRPECMAFSANARWRITSYAERALSFNPDPRQAIAEVLHRLRVAG